jgi:hypothetical protein
VVERAFHDAPIARSASSRADSTWVALIVFAALAAVTAGRVVHELARAGEPSAYAMQDFRDTVYYPARALLDGRNPYDATAYRAFYPIGSVLTAYAPAFLLLGLPFTALTQSHAEIAYHVLNLLLVLAFALLTLRLCPVEASRAAVLVLGSAILLSRPGHSNLFNGQSTLLVASGTYLALALSGRRPIVAGVGLALALLKPSFGLPLAVLLLAAGQVTTVVVGAAGTAVTSGPVAVVLARAAGGVAPLVRSVLDGAWSHMELSSNAPATSLRIDAVAWVGRLIDGRAVTPLATLVGVAILGAAAFTTYRLARSGDRQADPLRWCVGLLAILLAVYHQNYDSLVLTLPIVQLSLGRWQPATMVAGVAARWWLLGLLAVPLLNHTLNSKVAAMLGSTGDLLLLAVNPLAMMTAFVLCLWLARDQRTVAAVA